MFKRKYSIDAVKKHLWFDLQKSCAANTVALISYGASADSEYLSLTRDNNFLIVTNSLTAEDLTAFVPLQRQWGRKYKEYPLFMTIEDLKTSADIFPIEFLNMRDSYAVVGGQDVLKDLEIPLAYLRTQCELSIKGKIIILRQGYVENPANSKALIANSFPAFFKVFLNILRLSNKAIPGDHNQIIQEICLLAKTDSEVFITINSLPGTKQRLAKNASDNLFAKYLEGLQAIANYIDRLDVQG